MIQNPLQLPMTPVFVIQHPLQLPMTSLCDTEPSPITYDTSLYKTEPSPAQGRVHTFLSDIRRKNYEVKLENDSGRDPQRQ